jgi:multisubunit Na+/H+ antiporter MnhF subunit
MRRHVYTEIHWRTYSHIHTYTLTFAHTSRQLHKHTRAHVDNCTHTHNRYTYTQTRKSTQTQHERICTPHADCKVIRQTSRYYLICFSCNFLFMQLRDLYGKQTPERCLSMDVAYHMCTLFGNLVSVLCRSACNLPFTRWHSLMEILFGLVCQDAGCAVVLQ